MTSCSADVLVVIRSFILRYDVMLGGCILGFFSLVSAMRSVLSYNTFVFVAYSVLFRLEHSYFSGLRL